MIVEKFSGLFEDEVAEELTAAGKDCRIDCGIYTWRPARVLVEDGIVSDGDGWYQEHITGRKGWAIVGRGRLIDYLAHREFEIWRNE